MSAIFWKNANRETHFSSSEIDPEPDQETYFLEIPKISPTDAAGGEVFIEVIAEDILNHPPSDKM